MSQRRVVITGIGAVSPLGCDIETIWQRLLAGESGIRTLPEEIAATLSVKIGGQVPTLEQDPQSGFDPDLAVLPKDQKKMDRFIQFAMAAADQAIAHAGWQAESAEQQERTATVVGSGIGGFPALPTRYVPMILAALNACLRSLSHPSWSIWRRDKFLSSTISKAQLAHL